MFPDKIIERVSVSDKELHSGIRDLNPEYLTTRYPDFAAGIPAQLYDKNIAERHYKTAVKVLEWVKKQIK